MSGLGGSPDGYRSCTQGAQGALPTNDADRIKALEEELARLKAAQQNPQRDDDQIAQQLAALRNQLGSIVVLRR